MTTILPNKILEDAASILARLHLLLTEDGLESVRATVIGTTLVLEGSAGSYEAKCRIEKAAQTMALQLESSLRVIPGAFLESSSLS